MSCCPRERTEENMGGGSFSTFIEFQFIECSVYTFVYLQLTLKKGEGGRGKQDHMDANTSAVDVTGTAGLKQSVGRVGCRRIPQGALTLDLGGHSVARGEK